MHFLNNSDIISLEFFIYIMKVYKNIHTIFTGELHSRDFLSLPLALQHTKRLRHD